MPEGETPSRCRETGEQLPRVYPSWVSKPFKEMEMTDLPLSNVNSPPGDRDLRGSRWEKTAEPSGTRRRVTRQMLRSPEERSDASGKAGPGHRSPEGGRKDAAGLRTQASSTHARAHTHTHVHRRTHVHRHYTHCMYTESWTRVSCNQQDLLCSLR